MNAKQEISYLKFENIKCATIKYVTIKEIDTISISLKVGHTQEEFNAFMNALDFDYDNGYGSQELHGIIWLSNGNWMTRWEYDGSEGWEYNSLPEIPEELKS